MQKVGEFMLIVKEGLDVHCFDRSFRHKDHFKLGTLWQIKAVSETSVLLKGPCVFNIYVPHKHVKEFFYTKNN
jgi:hypothetical protein